MAKGPRGPAVIAPVPVPTQRIDIFVHVESSSSQIEARLSGIEHKLTAVLNLEEKLMATSQEIKDLVAALDSATNKIAARIADLISRLANATGGLTATEAQEIASALAAEKDRLEALGSDPTNPVP